MRIWKTAVIMFLFTAAAYAQPISPAADFFMYDRFYETFLRDHFRFGEAKPLRIEYLYANWLDSSEGADEYRDHLHLESSVPIYSGRKLIVDIPFQYHRFPVWAETEEATFGDGISVIEPGLITRWTIADRFRSIIGWEYNLKGDGENFGRSTGRQICLLKAFFSYDLHTQLNFVAGVRFDRYYYDTDEESDVFELADRLYYHPAIMLNWHPSNDFTVLLGIPAVGVHLALGNALKAEARAAIDKKVEVALRVRPFERTSATLRFLNIPYTEVPIEDRSFDDNSLVAERLYYTDKSIQLEMGRELNPAAIASVCFRYSPGSDLEFKDGDYENSTTLEGKPRFSVGVTFTVDIEVLAGRR